MKCNQHLINLRKVFWNGHQSAINEVVICVQVFKHILQWYGLFPCLVEVSSKVLYFRPSSTSTDVALYGLFQLSQRYFPDNIWSSQTFFSPVSLSSSEKKKKYYVRNVFKLHIEKDYFFVYCLLRNVYLTACCQEQSCPKTDVSHILDLYACGFLCVLRKNTKLI